jgi:hypothetical protein
MIRFDKKILTLLVGEPNQTLDNLWTNIFPLPNQL